MGFVRILMPARHSAFISLLVFISVLAGSLSAQAMPRSTIHSGADYLDLGPIVEYYIDPTRSLNVSEIRDLDDALWQRNTKSSIGFGFTDAVYWFRVHVTSNSIDSEFLLHAGNPKFDYIDTYQYTGEEVVHHKMGVGVSRSEKPIRPQGTSRTPQDQSWRRDNDSASRRNHQHIFTTPAALAQDTVF